MEEKFLWRRYLNFMDAAGTATSPQQVMTVFSNTIERFGYSSYIMATIPHTGTSFAKGVIANGWPAEWFDIYVSENLCAVDPVMQRALGEINPFIWSDTYDQNTDIASLRVMERARDFAMNEGMCIPIHYELSTAAISMAGDRPDVSLNTVRMITITGMMALDRIRGLMQKGQPPDENILMF